PRPKINAPRPVAQHATLEVKEFSGDFTRWVDRMTITERQKLTFRWKNIRGQVANPRWQVTNSPNAPLKSGIVRQGAVPKVPAKGAWVAFTVDTTNIMPLKPPASPRKYYVRIVVSERGRKDYVDSRPVVITYQQPSQEVTQFTEEGLSTTPPKKTAPPGDRTYHYPKLGGIAMDWCRRWARECGQPAADEFCRREGYRRAGYWSKNNHWTNQYICPGNVCKTRIIMNYSQVCHGKDCRGMTRIICTHDRDCQTKSMVLKTERKECSWDKTLKVVGKEGFVEVEHVPNQTNSVHNIPVNPKFGWYCGYQKETFSCPDGTTHVDVSRWATKYKGQKGVEFKCRKQYQVCKD
ncbi:MAG: hypothetical protein ACLFV8_13975, partial [Alphaproteobacteria bacterium]